MGTYCGRCGVCAPFVYSVRIYLIMLSGKAFRNDTLMVKILSGRYNYIDTIKKQRKQEIRRMEEKSIFRKKSLERVSSPEQLNDYIKVTTPSVWVILAAMLILIAGTLFWAVFGKIQVNTDTGVKEVAPIYYVIR